MNKINEKISSYYVVSLLNQLVDKYKWDEQLDLLQEELAELVVELSHLKRGREHHVEEEIADVLIMIFQIVRYKELDLDLDLVNKNIGEKLKRQKDKHNLKSVYDFMRSKGWEQSLSGYWCHRKVIIEGYDSSICGLTFNKAFDFEINNMKPFRSILEWRRYASE